jgi:hypothetical protein
MWAATAAEADVRRAAAERQSSHLAERLKHEHASYADLLAEYEVAVQGRALYAARSEQLQAEVEALQREVATERARGISFEETAAALREEAETLRKERQRSESTATVELSHQAGHARGMVSQQVEAEAARGRELAARLEAAVLEAREREAAAIASLESKVAAATAEGERRCRQLRLQLEQARESVALREREAAEAVRQQRAAETAARMAAEAEVAVRARLPELERRIDELRPITSERDALAARADQLARLVDAQSAELRRLQGSKANAKAAIAALRRQLATERQAHATAEARTSHQLRAHAEASALAAEVRRTPRGRRRRVYSDDEDDDEEDEDTGDSTQPAQHRTATALLESRRASVEQRARASAVRTLNRSVLGDMFGTVGVHCDDEDDSESDGDEAFVTPRPTQNRACSAKPGTSHATEASWAETEAQSLTLAARLKRDAQLLSATLRVGALGSREATSDPARFYESSPPT